MILRQARVTNDLNVNVVSPFIAAQEAIKNWETLPTETHKLFIYTGNICNVAVLPVPMLLNGGMGKAATAYWLGVADGAYAAKHYRQVFIYLGSSFENHIARNEEQKLSGDRALTLSDSFTPTSAKRMARSQAKMSAGTHMPISTRSWRLAVRRMSRGTPRLSRTKDMSNSSHLATFYLNIYDR